MTQNTLFDAIADDNQRKLEKLLVDIGELAKCVVADMDYPEGSIGVAVARNKTETNYPVQIRELRRSAESQQEASESESEVIADKNGIRLNYICSNIVVIAATKPKSKYAGCVELRMSPTTFNAVPVPKAEAVKERTTVDKDSGEKTLFRYDVLISLDSPDLLPYLKRLMSSRLLSYRSKEPMFGCCHLYEECSAAKKCVSKFKIYATACAYRRNLEAGKIFYGKGKTI